MLIKRKCPPLHWGRQDCIALTIRSSLSIGKAPWKANNRSSLRTNISRLYRVTCVKLHVRLCLPRETRTQISRTMNIRQWISSHFVNVTMARGWGMTLKHPQKDTYQRRCRQRGNLQNLISKAKSTSKLWRLFRTAHLQLTIMREVGRIWSSRIRGSCLRL